MFAWLVFRRGRYNERLTQVPAFAVSASSKAEAERLASQRVSYALDVALDWTAFYQNRGGQNES